MNDPTHPAHRLVGRRQQMLDHLVARHGAARRDLPEDGATLQAIHDRAHELGAGQDAALLTVAGLTGRAERLFRTALEALQAVARADRLLAADLAQRWFEALAPMARKPK